MTKKYRSVVLKDAKGERYTYHDADVDYFDSMFHIHTEETDAFFTKDKILMIALNGKVVPIEETEVTE